MASNGSSMGGKDLHRAPTAAISKSIPLSEVNRHCIPADCWVAIDDKVYDLTEFVDRHPGGPTTVLNSAGKDVTKMFHEIHRGVKIDQYLRPEAYVGSLGIDEDLMTDSFWHTLRKARVAEIEQELARLTAGWDEHPASKAANIIELLQERHVGEELREKLQRMETQKRVALDAEDFGKASMIRAQVDKLLVEARIELNMPPPGTGGGIPLSEVARHNKPHDCWVAFNGSVYDLTEFLVQHPEQRNAVLAWAGRDASKVWDKIPGRFPSQTWMDFYMRPEAQMGEVGPEPEVDPRTEEIQQLRAELRRLRGPSEEEIAASKAGASQAKQAAAEASKSGEDARFPKLADVRAGKALPFFTRAEVAKHKGPAGGPAGTEPYMIIHNKVYDLTPLLGAHPGGDEMLLTRAGTDATEEFEVFEHSEKARVRRDQDMLVGELVPSEHADAGAEDAKAGGAVGGAVQAKSEIEEYLSDKVSDVAMLVALWYLYRTWQHRKPLPKLMYSRGLRHLHLIMAAGIFGTLASAKAASLSEGLLKKRFLALHKQTGIAMLGALVLRIFFRSTSGIPPRFPGFKIVQAVETQSLRAFYVLCAIMPLSGLLNEYYLKWASGDDTTNDRRAQQAIALHKSVGNFFQNVWLPFHLGYTTLYHWSKGRGVVRKVSPFI